MISPTPGKTEAASGFLQQWPGGIHHILRTIHLCCTIGITVLVKLLHPVDAYHAGAVPSQFASSSAIDQGPFIALALIYSGYTTRKLHVP
jgi:hypothetical protein